MKTKKYLAFLLTASLCIFTGCKNAPVQSPEQSLFQLSGEVESAEMVRVITDEAIKFFDEGEGVEAVDGANDLFEGETIGYEAVIEDIYGSVAPSVEFNKDGSFKKIGDKVFSSKGDTITIMPQVIPEFYFNVLTCTKEKVGNEFYMYGEVEGYSKEDGEYTGKRKRTGWYPENLLTLQFDSVKRLTSEENDLFANLGFDPEYTCTYEYKEDERLPYSMTLTWDMGGTSGTDKFDIVYDEIDDHNNWTKRTVIFSEPKITAFSDTRTIKYF